MGNNVVIGEVDWNDGDVSSSSGSDFLRIDKKSSATVRVMTNPHQFYVYWLKNGMGETRRFNYPSEDPALIRRLEAEGFKRKPSWFVIVLDRADNVFRILEIGSQTFEGIKRLRADEEWGPLTGYDIKISRGDGSSQPVYTVNPRPHSPLDGSLKSDFQAFRERVDVSQFALPADPAKVREHMGWPEEAAATTTTSETEEDSFFNFED